MVTTSMRKRTPFRGKASATRVSAHFLRRSSWHSGAGKNSPRAMNLSRCTSAPSCLKISTVPLCSPVRSRIPAPLRDGISNFKCMRRTFRRKRITRGTMQSSKCSWSPASRAGSRKFVSPGSYSGKAPVESRTWGVAKSCFWSPPPSVILDTYPVDAICGSSVYLNTDLKPRPFSPVVS